MERFTLFSGTANVNLATAIGRELRVGLGACTVNRFPDGEVSVDVGETVRGREVFIVQPTCPPVNDHLMELLAMADACRRASAGKIIAVVPYFGYARSDKRHGRREPIMASMVALVAQTVGIDHLITMDLHAAQIEGFFQNAVDILSAVPVICSAIRDRLPPGTVVVSPDEGRVKMAAQYAQRLKTSVIVIHKHRETGSDVHALRVVGDVQERPCLIVDDMISTGGTIASSVEALLRAGARGEIFVAATHGLLLPGSCEKLNHPAIRNVFVTDTVPVERETPPGLSVITVAPLLAEAIRNIHAQAT
jgi:ribose-phosphate pyrophosphokinase